MWTLSSTLSLLGHPNPCTTTCTDLFHQSENNCRYKDISASLLCVHARAFFTLAQMFICKSLVLFCFTRTGRMDCVKMTLMALSCMRIGTKICSYLVMVMMADNSCYRFISPSLLLAYSVLKYICMNYVNSRN